MTTQPTPKLQRLRYAVRGALVLGLTASVIANVLHAEPNPISKVIAGWPPVALWIAIELVIHVPVDRPKLAWLRRAGTLLIAGIAAYVSYWHMAGVAERYGESGLSVFLLPLSVDGLIAVASICLVEISGRLRAERVQEDKTPPVPRTAPPHMRGVRQDGGEQYANSTTPPTLERAARPKQSGQSVAASAAAAADRLDSRDIEAVWAEVRRTTHPDVSRDTVRKSLSRIPTNGQVHA